MSTYKIVRHFRDETKENKVKYTGLTLEEAREHCNDPDHHELGVWFDGYTEE